VRELITQFYRDEATVTEAQSSSCDLNLIAIEELKNLLEADASVTNEWKKAMLGLINDGAVPSSLTKLEAVVKGGTNVDPKRGQG
jgi:hypothetical protein